MKFAQGLLCFSLAFSFLNACSSHETTSTIKSESLTPIFDVAAQKSDVVVQLFNWPFTKITDEIPLLSEIGYAQIHVSPPNLTIDSKEWWARYQPVDYRVIAGPLGSETEFQAMIDKAHAFGIKIIVDVVFNHTANTTSPLPKEAAAIVAKEGPLFEASDYNSPQCIANYDDTWQVRNQRMCGGGQDTGLPDLNQNSEHVLKTQRAFLIKLNSMGVDGFRLDAVKHMEPGYFTKLLTRDITAGKFVFGEVIADEHTFDRDIAPYLALDTMSLYDFPLRRTLQEAFGLYGSLETLVESDITQEKRALPWNRSVSFIMNHDIPNNQGFRAWIPDAVDEELSYAFIMGRSEGVPYVYSDLGTKGGAGLIDDRWDHYHRNKNVAMMVKFHNFAFGQPTSVLEADECTLLMKRGSKGVVAINKCAEERDFDMGSLVGEGKAAVELLTQETFQAGQKTLTLKVPGRSSRFVIFQDQAH